MDIKLAVKCIPDLEEVCELESMRLLCNEDEPINETINSISIYSIKKQIPVKPRLIDGSLKGEKYWWKCGFCGASMHTNTRHNYCHYCGQRVDWSELLDGRENVPKILLEEAKKPFPEIFKEERED